MSLFEERLADLPLRIEGYALERLQRDVSSAFTRVSTVIRMRGDGQEGLGEDVTYDAEDHDALQAAGAVLPLAGEWTLGSFCDHVEGLELWPEPPRRESSRLYRVWAYESTALDLALRQAGTSLHAAVGREPRAVRFVVSLRLGEPPTLDPVARRLERYPSLRFKLDPTSDWTPELIAELVATGAVDSVDFKGLYVGPIVDQPADPVALRRVVERLPRGLDRGSQARPPRPTRSSTRTATASPGTRRSTRSPTSRPSPSRRGWSTSSRRAWDRCARSSPPTSTASNGASACTAAGSSSSVRAATTSSTWPRSFIPTRPTTWRRAATTIPTSRRAVGEPAGARPARDRLSLGLADLPTDFVNG